MPRIKVSETRFPGVTLVKVQGQIDERLDPDLLSRFRGVVVFDLDGITRITSFGVRQWMTALGDLRAEYYCFIRCHYALMDQFNMVSGFAGRGELVSMYAPYSCVECEHLVEKLIDLRQDHEALELVDLPDLECPKCHGRAELDTMPELYFQYVRSVPRPRPPAAANAVIDGRGAADERGFQMRKEVRDSITAFRLSGYLDKRAYLRRAADGVEGLVVLDMSELDGISPDGTAGLIRFLESLHEPPYFARVPPSMLAPLVELATNRPKAGFRLVSLRLPFHCAACNSTSVVDCDADSMTAFAQGTRETPICPRCAQTLRPGFGAEVVQPVARLPVSAPPPALQSFLGGPITQSRDGPGGVALAAAMAVPTEPLLGKYQLLNRLGQGGMGETFLARQVGPEDFEKMVVLKRIRRDRLRSREARDLFVREARIAARLSHPNIVQIFDLERVADEYFISMEYVNGIDLGRALRISRAARLNWPVVICCRLVADLCSALHAAHTAVDESGRLSPVIHRDVQPGNILLSIDGRVKLADFGIAKILGDSQANEAIASDSVRYSAPEQRAPSDWPVDARVDIYSAGVVLFETLTLRPFAISSTGSASLPPIRQTLPQICVWRTGVPPVLQTIFERAIRPEPSERYANAHELERDLERLLKVGHGSTRADFALWARHMIELDSADTSGATRSSRTTLPLPIAINDKDPTVR